LCKSKVEVSPSGYMLQLVCIPMSFEGRSRNHAQVQSKFKMPKIDSRLESYSHNRMLHFAFL
jgi:hypothetical protein